MTKDSYKKRRLKRGKNRVKGGIQKRGQQKNCQKRATGKIKNDKK